MTENETLFTAGSLTATSAAVTAFNSNRADIMDYLNRHLRGDWGTITTATFLQNVEGISDRQEIRSEYALADKTSFCVVTNRSRTETCVSLLCESITEASF